MPLTHKTPSVQETLEVMQKDIIDIKKDIHALTSFMKMLMDAFKGEDQQKPSADQEQIQAETDTEDADKS